MIQSITELMIRDHERLMNLFSDFKNNKNRDLKKAKELFTRFDRELRKHMTVEEKIIKSVFGVFGIDGDKIGGNVLPIASSLRLEHDRIRNVLEKILSSTKNNNKTINTFNLYLILRHHKNMEERLFYPELDEMLSEKEKSIVFDKIKNK